MIRYFIIAVLTLLLSACGEDKPTPTNDNTNQGGKPSTLFEDCPYGAPVAIFSSEMDSIKGHDFNLEAEESIEKVLFNNDMMLTLVQSGCKTIKQEFLFRLPQATKEISAQFWIQKAAGLFAYMASADDKLGAFNQWASMISSQQEDLQLGKSLEVSDGIFIKIDKVSGSAETSLIVELSQSQN